MPNARYSQATLKKVRDYAVEEPSFTCAFMAWELKMSVTAINAIVKDELLRLGIVKEIEPRTGPYAAVYAYVPIPKGSPRRRLIEETEPEPKKERAEAVPGTGKRRRVRGGGKPMNFAKRELKS